MKFQNINETFKKISKKMLDGETKLILTCIYFLIFPIFVVIAKLTNKERPSKEWSPWKKQCSTREDLARQF